MILQSLLWSHSLTTLNASYLPKEADMMETELREGAINQLQDPGPFPSRIPFSLILLDLSQVKNKRQCRVWARKCYFCPKRTISV